MVDKRKAVGIGAVALIAAAVMSGGAVAAYADTTMGAADTASSANITPGSTFNAFTGTVVSSGSGAISDSNVTWDFYAPSYSTFADSKVEYFKRDGRGINSITASGTFNSAACTLVSSTHIQCKGTLTTPAKPSDATTQPDQYYVVHLKADSTAPLGSTFHDGKLQMTGTNSGQGSVTNASSTYGYSTISAAATPMIDPAVGGVAAAGLAAVGAGVFAFRRKKAMA